MGRSSLLVVGLLVVHGCTYTPIDTRVRDSLRPDGRAGGDGRGGGDAPAGDYQGDGDAPPPITNVDRGPWRSLGDSDHGSWTQRLGSSASAGGVSADFWRSSNPTAALTPSGELFVAWEQFVDDTIAPRRIRVRIYDTGTGAWTDASSDLLARGDSAREPDLAAADDGSVWLTWRVSEGADVDVYAAQYDSGSWGEVMGSATAGGVSESSVAVRTPSIAMRDGSTPCIAWGESPGSSQDVYVKCLGAGGWGPADGTASLVVSDAPNGPEPRPDLAGIGDTLFLAWQGADLVGATGVIRALRLEGGSTWEALASSDAVAGLAASFGGSNSEPSIAATATSVLVGYRYTSVGESCIHVLQWTTMTNSWEQLDSSATNCGVSTGATGAEDPDLLLLGGRPVVAWSEGQNLEEEIAFAAFDGSSWGTPANLSGNPGQSVFPSLCTDDSDLFVAWEDNTSGEHEIYAREIIGNSRPEFGGVAMSGGLSNSNERKVSLDMVMQDTGEPAVVWTAGGLLDEVLEGARSAGSGVWTSLGTVIPAYGGIKTPELEVLGSDLVAVWQERLGNDTDIVFGRAAGAAWDTVTGDGNNRVVAVNVSSLPQSRLGLGLLAGEPWVAWTDNVNHPGLIPEVYLRKFEVAWGPVGMSDSGGGISDAGTRSEGPVLVLGTEQYAVWTEGSLQSEIVLAAQFDGALGAWVEVDLGEPSGLRVDATLDTQGRLVVAYEERVTTTRSAVAVLRLELDGQVTDLGKLGTGPGYATNPRVGIDALGAILVVWEDSSSGQSEIYLRRYADQLWHELSSSATGGGISNSTGRSRNPAVVASDDYICVSWFETDSRAPQVSVRCVDGM